MNFKEELSEIKNNTINQTEKLLKEKVKNENSFLKKILYLISFGLIISIVFNFIIFFSKNYFVIQPNGKVEKLIAKELNITPDMLYTFADTVIINTFNYSYRDIDQLFDRNSLYYSTIGLNNLKQAFKESNLIEYTKELKLTKSTIPTNEIYKITSSTNGVYIYRSYSSEEITKNKRNVYPSIIYELDITKVSKADGYLYKLQVNGVREYTWEEYKNKFK